jgi:hypothetical protein
VSSLQTVRFGYWLIKSDMKHDARSAQCHGMELHHVRSLCVVVTVGIRWDEKVDGKTNKKEYNLLNDHESGKPT